MGRKVVAGDQGKMGRLFLEGNELCVEDWDIQETCQEEDTTSTCDGGNPTQEYSQCQLEGTINASWDASVNIFDAPFSICVGEIFTSSKLYISASSGVGSEDGPFFLLDLQVTNGLKVSVPVKGKVAITIPFKSNGTYTKPTGTVSASGA